ncbi:MAG: aldo/keto reductase [Ignavibacteriales bacterium]|nr:aldo/keto reductase [Ignavibacteriales bacterium]
MNYRSFGRLGWKVSEIGFGAWAIGGDMWGAQDDVESLRALHRAADLGVNFIDTAQGYGKGHSEEVIGRFLKERREEFFVATKVPAKPGSPWPLPMNARSEDFFPASYVIAECEKSLKRLGRDAIDVYQFHTWDSSLNTQDEWFGAMSTLKRQGKIRAAGVSVPDTDPDSAAGGIALGRIDSVQLIYNIFEQVPAWNMFPLAEKLGTAIIVRVPFDEGALTGKYSETTTFADNDVRRHYFRGNNLKSVVRKVNEVRAYKDRHHPGMSMADYALKFCLTPPAVSTVIPGIRSVQQAELNCSASDGENLNEEELHGLRNFFWRKDFWHEEVKN